jgi:hypothetical protein
MATHQHLCPSFPKTRWTPFTFGIKNTIIIIIIITIDMNTTITNILIIIIITITTITTNRRAWSMDRKSRVRRQASLTLGMSRTG